MTGEKFPNQKFHELADGLANGYQPIVDKLREDFRDLAVVMNKTFYLFTAALTQIQVTKNQESQDIFHFLMGRAMKTYRAITVLLFEGLEQDAFALLRSLVEVAIVSKYIGASNTKQRADRFREYKTIEEYKFMVAVREIDPDHCAKTFPEHKAKEIEVSLSEYIKKYGVKYSDGLSWSNMSYFKMASLPEVDMVDEFIKEYSVYSMFTHASYQAMEDYTQVQSGRRIIALGPSRKRPETVGLLATGNLLQVVKVYIDTLGIEGLNWLVTEVNINLSARMPQVGQTSKFGVNIKKGTWGMLPDFEDLKKHKPSE